MVSSETFRQATYTVRNEDRNFTSWHRGRPWFHFWNVAIDDPEWCAQAHAAAGWLSDFLVPDYHRQPHVTLLPSGFTPLTTLQHDRARALANAAPRFEIRLGPLSSFTASPCFAIESDGCLHRLRTALMAIQADAQETTVDGNYAPHLTVGLYRDRFRTARVANRIAEFAPGSLASLRVDQIMLCRYDTSSIKGPIETVAEFELGAGSNVDG